MFRLETFQKSFKQFFHKEKGAVLVIFALSLLPLLGIAALVIDRANILYDKLALQSCADSAVLGGVGTLDNSDCFKNGKKKKKCTNNGDPAEASLRANYLYAANIAYLGITPTYTITVINAQQLQITTKYTSPTLLAAIVVPSWINTVCNTTSQATISPSTGKIVLMTGPS